MTETVLQYNSTKDILFHKINKVHLQIPKLVVRLTAYRTGGGWFESKAWLIFFAVSMIFISFLLLFFVSMTVIWKSTDPKSMGECNTILSAYTLYRH